MVASLLASSNDTGETPLHLAEKIGYKGATTLLIDNAAKIDAEDNAWVPCGIMLQDRGITAL